LGEVTRMTESEAAGGPRLLVRGLDDSVVIDSPIATLKAAWQRPLAWP
jgi:hypothetical protein